MSMTKLTLTPEEKARWKPMLQRTWNAIAYDAIQCCGGEASQSDAIEFTLDADRPMMHGGLTREEQRFMYQLWAHAKAGPAFRKWLRQEVFTSKAYVI
jgi:hypothetical protein